MRFSIITINYNNIDGLLRTMESVEKQTYKDFEYIIIDGGSTDGSVDLIKRHTGIISYWISEPDDGIYNAMNKGANYASGDYLIFMNSGDCFHTPNVLNSIKEYPEDIICGKIIRGNSSIASGHKKDSITLIDLIRDTLPHQAMLIKKEIMAKYPYDEKYKIYADWKFCVEAIILGNCSFRNIDTIIANYDLSGISAKNNSQRIMEKEAILNELFPQRILADYKRIAMIDDELINLSRLLTKTVRARIVIKTITKLILHFSNKNIKKWM